VSTWKKVQARLATRFDAALPVAADVVRRKMFGCPAALFAGPHEDRPLVRRQRRPGSGPASCWAER
jgi:hypothetical protein